MPPRGLRWSIRFAAAALFLFGGGQGQAQTAGPEGRILLPHSSIETPGDAGWRAHSNIEIYALHGGPGPSRPGMPEAASPRSIAPATGSSSNRPTSSSNERP